MNLGTTGCTELIMEDNSIMHLERAIIRKIVKMWEQFLARAECQSFREAENNSRSLREDMHIKALPESTPKSRPGPKSKPSSFKWVLWDPGVEVFKLELLDILNMILFGTQDLLHAACTLGSTNVCSMSSHCWFSLSYNLAQKCLLMACSSLRPAFKFSLHCEQILWHFSLLVARESDNAS